MQPSSSPSIGEVLEVIRPHVEKVEEGFKAIRVTLDALAAHLAGGASRAVTPRAEPVAVPSEPVPPPAVEPPRPVAVARPEPPRAVAVERPRPAVARPPRAEPVAVAEPVAAAPVGRPGAIPVSAGGGAGNLSQIIFGEQLAVPGVPGLSGSLLSDIYAGSPDALGLVGQLLCLRSSNAERKPRYLKDLGEAFYRWNPQADPAVRDPLIAWVHALLDADGLTNRIDIVQVGDRYDMQRHNTTDRGVEVADVFGWVILRDNGKVFSKANVSLR